MKFESYLYIDYQGNIIEASKKPTRSPRARSVCLKVSAEIPDEHFDTPMFGVDILFPHPVRKKKGSGGVQEWLTQEVEQIDEEYEDEEDKDEYIDPYDSNNVPF